MVARSAKGSPPVSFVGALLVTATLLAGCSESGSISGRVVLTGLENHEGVTLTIAGPTSAATVSTEAGAYTFSGLPSGLFAITAEAASTLERTRTAMVDVSGPAMVVDLRFTPVGEIEGTAKRFASADQGGIVVTALGGGAASITDAAGRFLLRDVAVGGQSLAASFGEERATVEVVVTRGQRAVASLLELVRRGETGSIEGRVVLGSVEDRSGVSVTLVGPVAAATATELDGTFRFDALAAGSYSICAEAASTRERRLCSFVELGPAPATLAAFSFTAVGVVVGRVGLADAPLASAGIGVQVPGTDAVTATDPAGDFHLQEIPVGEQTVVLSHPGYATRTIPSVQVTYSATTTVGEVWLEPARRAAVVKGNVSVAGSPDRSGVTVRLEMGWPPRAVATTTSTTSGAYVIENVPPGIYELVFEREGFSGRLPSLVVERDVAGIYVHGMMSPVPDFVLPRGRLLFHGVPADWPVISPDGNTMLYVESFTDWTGQSVRLMQARTSIPGTPTRVADLVDRQGHRFSPDGSRILFRTTTGDLRTSEVGVQPTRLVATAVAAGLFGYSADSSKIVFVAGLPGGGAAWHVAEVDGSAIRRLDAYPAEGVHRWVFTPDASAIVTLAPPRKGPMRLVPLSGAPSVLLDDQVDVNLGAEFDGTGRRLLYLSGDQLKVLDLATLSRRPVFTMTPGTYRAQFLDDGEGVLVDDGGALVLASATGSFAPRRLLPAARRGFEAPWVQLTDDILLVGAEGPAQQLFALSMASSTTRLLASGVRAYTFVRGSGRVLFRRAGDDWLCSLDYPAVQQVELDGTAPYRGGLERDLSPDGRHLLVTRSDRTLPSTSIPSGELRLVPLDGTPATILTTGAAGSGQWAGPNRIVATRPDHMGADLFLGSVYTLDVP